MKVLLSCLVLFLTNVAASVLSYYQVADIHHSINSTRGLVRLIGTNETNETTFEWNLRNLYHALNGTITVHNGSSCTDPGNITLNVTEYSTSMSGMSKGKVNFKKLSANSSYGRPVLIWNSERSVIGCGMLEAPKSLFANMLSFPGVDNNVFGYVKVIPVGPEKIQLDYFFGGFDKKKFKGQWHIHTGKTCSFASQVGGHYFPEKPDPWINNFFNFDNDMGPSMGSKNFSFSLEEVTDRAVVLHDDTGAKIGCGIIQQQVAMSAHIISADYLTSTRPNPIKNYQVYPASRGYVTIKESLGGIVLSFNFINVPATSNKVGWHVHAGSSCATGPLQKGHFFCGKNVDPWVNIKYSPKSGYSSGTVAVSGCTFNNIYDKVIVIHNENNYRIGCGKIEFTRRRTAVIGPLSVFSHNAAFTDSTGIVEIKPTHTGIVMKYCLFGVEKSVPYGPIHIHSGSSCKDQKSVGGHFQPTSFKSDPFKLTQYSTTSTGSGCSKIYVAGLTVDLVTGLTVVVHAKAGSKVLCGRILPPRLQSVQFRFNNKLAGIVLISPSVSLRGSDHGGVSLQLRFTADQYFGFSNKTNYSNAMFAIGSGCHSANRTSTFGFKTNSYFKYENESLGGYHGIVGMSPYQLEGKYLQMYSTDKGFMSRCGIVSSLPIALVGSANDNAAFTLKQSGDYGVIEMKFLKKKWTSTNGTWFVSAGKNCSKPVNQTFCPDYMKPCPSYNASVYHWMTAANGSLTKQQRYVISFNFNPLEYLGHVVMVMNSSLGMLFCAPLNSIVGTDKVYPPPVRMANLWFIIAVEFLTDPTPSQLQLGLTTLHKHIATVFGRSADDVKLSSPYAKYKVQVVVNFFTPQEVHTIIATSATMAAKITKDFAKLIGAKTVTASSFKMGSSPPSRSPTKAPTSKAPTSKAPTSKAPTSKAPTSKAPTSKAPTNATKAPTNATKAPTNATKAPTNATKAPTNATKAPTNATKAPTKTPTMTSRGSIQSPLSMFSWLMVGLLTFLF